LGETTWAEARFFGLNFDKFAAEVPTGASASKDDVNKIPTTIECKFFIIFMICI
jgi:hypothetical protein